MIKRGGLLADQRRRFDAISNPAFDNPKFRNDESPPRRPPPPSRRNSFSPPASPVHPTVPPIVFEDDEEVVEPPPPPKRGGRVSTDFEDDVDVNEIERFDLLAKIAEAKRRGVYVTKNYTIKSSLNELRLEYGRIQYQQHVDSVRDSAGTFLEGGVGMLEIAQSSNSALFPRPLRGKLDGVSRFVSSRISEYDSAFEALGDQYGTSFMGKSANPLFQIIAIFLKQLFSFFVDSWNKSRHMATPLVAANEANAVSEAVKQTDAKWEARLSQERQAAMNAFNQQASELARLRAAAAPPTPATAGLGPNDPSFWHSLSHMAVAAPPSQQQQQQQQAQPQPQDPVVIDI